MFNNNIVHKVSWKNNLVLILDDKYNFKEHIDKTLCKPKRGIRILRKLYHFKTKIALFRIYKTFISTHLDNCDVICDRPSNASFSDEIELGS